MTPLLLAALSLVTAQQPAAERKTVRVKVVDDRGLPITRALVRPDFTPLLGLSSGVEPPEVVHRGWLIPTIEFGDATDSEDGVYECRLNEYLPYPIAYVERDGVIHTGRTRVTALSAEIPDEFTITIPRPMSVKGTIYGSDGKPAAHASVVIGRGGSIRSLHGFFFFDDGCSTRPWAETLTADAQGQFEVMGIQPGEVSLSAFTESCVVPHTLHLDGCPGATVEANLNLMAACWIEAKVEPKKPGDKPIHWRTVRAGRDGESFPELTSPIGEADSVRLGPLGPGTYEVLADSVGGRPVHSMSVALRPGGTKVVDFPAALAAGPRLRGRVAPELIEGVSGAVLRYRASPMAFAVIPLAADGTFEIQLLEPGPILVSLAIPQAIDDSPHSPTRLHVAAQELVEVWPGGRTDFELGPCDGTITVQVPILESGWIGGARLLLSERPRFVSSLAEQRTSDGSVTWKGLAPGRYVVELYRGGWLEPERSLGTFPVIVK